jgi:hydrogenase expression/formation protein HypE
VNDLAVSGARPRWLSLSFILEEGLEISVLERVLDSIAEAARSASVQIVAGDTKVVPRGAADRMFITTSGIGELVERVPPGPRAIEPSDVILVSGSVGRHGIAILNARQNLGFEPPPLSDCASLLPLTEGLQGANVRVRAMRDATRGGVAAVLHEWASACGHTLCIEESLLPVDDTVRGAAELLGLDPIHIANEGTLLLAVPPSDEQAALAALRRCPSATAATRIGVVRTSLGTPVTIRRGLGRPQPLDLPSGSQLPRIC